MIRVSVDGRPEAAPFDLEPPQPAETVIEAVAIQLEVDTGILKAGRELFVGKTAVPAGDYVFKTRAARAEGTTAPVARAEFEAAVQAQQQAQELERQERLQLQQEVTALKFQNISSITRKAEAGAAILAGATLRHDLVEELAPLDEDMLQRVVTGAAAAFREANAVPLSDLKEDVVQQLFVSLLSVVQAAAPSGRVQMHDTHAVGLSGMHRCKPDIAVTDCWLPLAPHIVDFYELKPLLAKESAQHEAAFQVEQRRLELIPEQPGRGVFWACTGGRDVVQLWRVERGGKKQISPPLPLHCGRDSPGLQAIVRLWSTAPSKKGYAGPEIPPTITLPDQRQLLHCSKITSSSSAADDAASADVTSVILGKLSPDNTFAVAKSTSNTHRAEKEEAALRALAGVQGVVRLLGVGTSEDGARWLVMQPFGSLMDLGATAATKISAVQQVASIIGRLASANYIHGDISHFNVVQAPSVATSPASNGYWFLIDFGTARELIQDSLDFTGTPVFMALSTLLLQRQTESSDLESAFYVFLYWATQGQLHWRHARLGPNFEGPDAFDRKWSAMTIRFQDKVLARISEPELRRIATQLQGLFFGGNPYAYNTLVTSKEFLHAISSAR